MQIDSLIERCMDKVSSLQDTTAVLRALNATIDVVNSKINGVYDRRAVVKSGTPVTGYVLDGKTLSMAGSLKELDQVWVGGYDVPWPVYPREFVTANNGSTTYAREGTSKIIFSQLPETPTIYLEGLFCLGHVVASDTEIDVPSSWDAGIAAGTLWDLLIGKEGDKELRETMGSMWQSLLDDINEWSDRRVPEYCGQLYNYQNPGGCIHRPKSSFQ